MVIDAFSDLETEVRKIEIEVCKSSSDKISTLNLQLKQAEEIIRSLKQEIDDHKKNITTLSKNYQQLNTTSEAEGSTSLEFNTVLDALSEAEQEYSILEIFNSARRSARRARYYDYEQIYLAFTAIAEIGEKYFQYRRQSISMGNGLKEEFRERGFVDNYRPTEHEATENQYGDRREFCHGDRCVQILRHLTFKNNGCSLQIYFDFEFMQEQEKVIIGYCGEHLPTASQ